MKSLNPIDYVIHLEPDLKSFTFSGSTVLRAEAEEPVAEVTLDMIDLAVRSCKVRIGEDFKGCAFRVDPGKEELCISLPRDMEGVIELKLDYVGFISDRLTGFYRSRYTKEGKTKYIAVTQFEESDARRAFPCLDHPVKKAAFDVEMVVEEDLMAVSNGPVVQEKSLGNGKKWVKFERTPRMSTYLVFFGVGEFEFISDPGEVSVRVITTPGMTKYARFALEFGRKSLQFCESYYEVPYPLSKLDLLAIPDFAAGAMENWGAITFRENLLLHFPNITSRAGEERICEVIAHEIAHQWFGNLVSPSDWKYLWLNESFATYFAYGTVDHYYPEWDVWALFLHGQTELALHRDALHEDFSIEIPGGAHVVINASTAPIIYNKGGSILRQIKGYLGEDYFRDGLRFYLKTNQYGCAASSQLWEALEEVSKTPVIRMMKSWIEQPGFPLVEARRSGNALLLSQKRFTYLPNDSRQAWLVPIHVQIFYENGETASKTTLLEDATGTLDMGPGVKSYKVNAGQSGFFRVKYLDAGVLQELGGKVLRKELVPEDRWGLQNDLFALVMGGEATIDQYLDFLDWYRDEDAFLPLGSIAGNLFRAYLVVEDPERERIRTKGKSFLEEVVGRLGYEPAPAERYNLSALRDQALWQAVLYGSKEAETFGLDAFSSLKKGGAVHPDIMKSVLQIGARSGGEEAFDWFHTRLQSTESEHERMNILMALGCFKSKEMIEKVREYVLEKVPDRNKFVPLVSLAANPHALPDMWEWYVSRVKELERFHPIHYERVILAVVPLGGLGRETEVEAFFDKYLRETEKARDVIRLSLEWLRIYSAMRKRAGLL